MSQRSQPTRAAEPDAAELRRRISELEGEILHLRRLAGAGSEPGGLVPAFLSGVNLLESIEDGFVAFDAQWRFVYLNRNAERLLRRRGESLLGKVLWEEYPELAETRSARIHRRVMEQRVAGQSEEYYQPLARWFEARSFPAPDGGIFVFFSNITERKLAEAALRRSEERWRSLANAMPQFVWISRSYGDTQFINDYWFEYTGLPRGDLSTAGWARALHPDDLTSIDEMWQEALTTGTERAFEYRVKRASDGMWRWHRGFHRPERDSSGTIVRWIGTGFDIHDLKLAQEALRESEQRQRLAIEAGGAGVWDWDIEANRVIWSKRMYEFHGLEPGTFEGTTEAFRKLLHPDDVPQVSACIRRALEEGAPYRLEFRTIRPSGEIRWLSTSARVVRDEQGRSIRVLGVTLDITERKAAEEAVRASEERFRAMVETTPECVKVVAADGTLLHMNSAGLAMAGAGSAEEIIGKSVYERLAPEFREPYRAFHESICRGERGSMEFAIVDSQGRRQHMETHAAPLRNPDGTTAQLAITRDVTGRKSGESTAWLLGAIVDSSDDAIISKNLNGVITSWNQSAQRLFGYTAEEAIGRTVAELLVPDDLQDEEPNILMRLARGERVDHFETLRKCKDGSLLDVSLTISPVKDEQGRIIGASKIARDISGRKRAEAALMASEARFRLLADSMPQLVWTAGSDGEIDYYNQRWYEFTGFSREQFGDRSFATILHPEDREGFLEAWRESVASGGPYQGEYRFWDRYERRWRWFTVRALAVRSQNGNIAKWFGSCTDIDEQKRIEQELRQANQDLEQFAFSASHDLQEPLRSIKIYGELLTARYASKLDGEALEFLEYLKTGATRMQSLVRDLLAYTQVAKLDPPQEATDSNEVLAQALEDLGGSIAECGACVTFDPLPPARVHGTHLGQLFQNLISNAIKYRSPERTPVVHVSGKQEHGYCVFSVRDNGIGIAPEYKEQIFGLFKRLHTGEEYSGTGIGLAICQRMVERYRGRVWVESECGKGSTFLFTVPA
jgi:PAS domain S-box-containing protein